MKYIYKNKMFSLFMLFASVTIYLGCSENISNVNPIYDVFIINSDIENYKIGSTKVININAPVDSTLNISINGFDVEADKYSPYNGTRWKLESTPNSLPSFISATFEKEELDENEAIAKLNYKTTGALINGTYTVRISTEGDLFNSAKTMTLSFVVSVAPVNISVDLMPDSLVVAPGETDSIKIKINGIKQGEQFKLSWGFPADELKPHFRLSDSIFNFNKNEAWLSLALPISQNPGREAAAIYILNTISGSMIDFEPNGFLVVNAGFKFIRSELASYNTKIGDTLNVKVSYSLFGNGVFAPKLEPPSANPPLQIDILQDVKTISGGGDIDVNYKVVFREKPPGNSSLNFSATGSISYGKAVPGKVLIKVN